MKELEKVLNIEERALDYNFKTLLIEQNMWSRLYGKVLVIFGVSSAGKTTLSKKFLHFGFNYINMDILVNDLFFNKIKTLLSPDITDKSLSMDDINAFLYDINLNKEYTNEQLKQLSIVKENRELITKEILEKGILSPKSIMQMAAEEVKKYIARGENVIIDIILTKETRIAMFNTFFNFHKILILLYTPLEENLNRCFARNKLSKIEGGLDFRPPSLILDQFMKTYISYSCGQKGVKIDKDKIMNCLDNSVKMAEESLPTSLFDLKDIECIVKETKLYLSEADKVFIAPHIKYDICISFNGVLNTKLIEFLVSLSSYDIQDLVLPLGMSSNFFPFYQQKSDVLKIGNKFPLLNRCITSQKFHKYIEFKIEEAQNDILQEKPSISKNLPSPSKYNILTILNKLNEYSDYFLRKLSLPNKYQEMQQLTSKYKMSTKVVDDESLKIAYKKIALETHPDKTIGISEELRADMQKDFMKAGDLLKQNVIVSSEIYKPVMDKLYKANLFIKVADTSIDITKGLIKPTLENGLKISIDCIQLSAMYYSNYAIMVPTTALGVLYQIYNSDYIGATASVVTSTGIVVMSAAVYAAAPALSVTLTAGFTGYTGYTMLKNAYELYYEWQDMKIISNLEHVEEIINYD